MSGAHDLKQIRRPGRGRPWPLAWLLSILALASLHAGAANLVYNGDFEASIDGAPPPGWAMWGARRYKIPRNFSGDTTNPHRGKACYRIHKPAGHKGYTVSHPDRALKLKKAKKYVFTFWARTDKPGPSVFYLESYLIRRPYKEATSPGRFPFQVTTEWREFTFSIVEGRDFLADQSPYAMLAFRVSMDPQEEKTLWIDDVIATEGEASEDERLIDESALKYTPFQHRLEPGARVQIRIDASRRRHRTPKEVGGVSFHRVCGWSRHPHYVDGKYVLEPALLEAIREMRLPMTRFYAVGAEKFGVRWAIDRIAELLDKLDIPQETTVLELEPQSANERYSPEIWAKAVKHSAGKGYRFRHWEVANEPYTRKATAFSSPADYVAHVKSVGAAVRDAQPDALIGVGIWPDHMAWGNGVLKAAAGHYDFIVPHHYAGASGKPKACIEYVALTLNYQKLDRILRLNELARQYNPDREVYQYDTEWGMTGLEPEARNANIYGTLHRAVRLISMLREPVIRGASSWEMFSNPKYPTFMVLSRHEPGKRGMIYWLYRELNRHVGDWVVELGGTSPYYKPTTSEDPEGRLATAAGPLTPAVATVAEDGSKLYVVIANASWDEAQACEIQLDGFAASKPMATSLSHPDPDAHPLVKDKADVLRPLAVAVADQTLHLTLPAHSVTFVRIER